MRIIITACAIALALSAAPVMAQGQKVEVIKARGANAAGVCAGALDMMGQYMSRASNPDPNRISQVTLARDFFAQLPRFPSTEISAAATAFVDLMVKRLRNAQTVEERQSIQKEIVKISNGCFASAKNDLKVFRDSAPTTTVPLETVPSQTYTIEPTQPSTIQPDASQPFILTPLQPGTIQ